MAMWTFNNRVSNSSDADSAKIIICVDSICRNPGSTSDGEVGSDMYVGISGGAGSRARSREVPCMNTNWSIILTWRVFDM